MDMALVRSLQLPVEGETELHTPTLGAGTAKRNTYRIGLILLSGPEERLILSDLRVVGINLSAQRVQVLLGRDVLSRCLLVYDGKHQSMTLAY